MYNLPYAMVAICQKFNDNDQLCVRRVLISFKGTDVEPDPYPKKGKVINYIGTRFIDADDYFKDETRSHKYKFDDDGYVLISSNNIDEILVGDKRKYHYYDTQLDEHGYVKYKLRPIEFQAESDEEAIKMFRERTEVRD